ncbi:MAG: twin-arginine translocation signal domain-containing protein [Opitutaceae bacterium]|nr:twin-arginine translocation signal domain-containing protein [Opitutaceae bacterium]
MSTRRSFLKTATALAGVCALNQANSAFAASVVPAGASAPIWNCPVSRLCAPNFYAAILLPKNCFCAMRSNSPITSWIKPRRAVFSSTPRWSSRSRVKNANSHSRAWRFSA